MTLACGTLSYRQAPLERALEGIRKAGFQSVELGCVCGYCEHVRPEEMTRPDVERLSKLLRQFDLEVISLAGHVDLQYPLLGKGPEVADRGFERLWRRMQSPALGINYDAANVRFYTGQDPVADLESCEADLADYLIHVHIKDHAGC